MPGAGAAAARFKAVEAATRGRVAAAARAARLSAVDGVARTTTNLRNSFVESDAVMPPYLQLEPLWRYQLDVRIMYKKTTSQVLVAVLIGGNFFTNIIEATVDPQKNKYPGVFRNIEVFFNIAFLIELLVNMYAYWCKSFWKSSWNIFDFLVVCIGLLTMTDLDLPGPLTMLRNMRAFRVFRLFKRIQSLRKILVSLAKAVPGVFNAFVILLLVMSIYSILAVEFWSTFGEGGKLVNEHGVEVEYLTPRGQDFGLEYFGNFPKSLYTMFQVMSTDSWAEAVARPLMSTPDSFLNVATAFYFVSFQIICETILINVVVAVLLEKMVDDAPLPEPDDDDDLDLVSVRDRQSEVKTFVSDDDPPARLSEVCGQLDALPGAIIEEIPVAAKCQPASPSLSSDIIQGVTGLKQAGVAECYDVHSLVPKDIDMFNDTVAARNDGADRASLKDNGRRKPRLMRLHREVAEMKTQIAEIHTEVARLVAALRRRVPEPT
mmetsp:Transcript_42249/g.122114  ORF Transcript_42249/g.122114 Transcript_42249/m.122114 type:complete len:490 (-) Transcript_42249:109-1578(-)